MTESKFAFKSALTFLWLVVLIGLLCMLSKPVHAFESFEIDPEPVAYNPAEDDWHFEYRDDDYYLYGGDYSFMGWDLSIPVPYYADRDHVSLFTSFSFQINNDYLYHDWCFYVAPADEYVLRNTLNGYGSVFLEGFAQQASSTVNSYRGTATFEWMPNNNCNMTYCMLKYDDGYYTTFKFFCVFDLELRYPQMEMRPFRLGVWDRSQNPSYTGVNWLLYLQNYRFCVLDTQVYSLLDQRLQLIINQLDDLEVSVDLSSIETLINEQSGYILDLSSIMGTFIELYKQFASSQSLMSENIQNIRKPRNKQFQSKNSKKANQNHTTGNDIRLHLITSLDPLMPNQIIKKIIHGNIPP